jgi:hypothetical protein
MSIISENNWSNDELKEGDLSSNRMDDAREYSKSVDEDDENLSDDSVGGRDLDTDNGDEWDEDNMSEKEFDDDELDTEGDLDDEETERITGSGVGGRSFLGTPTSATATDPDELPEEHEADTEINYPHEDGVEQSADEDYTYKEQNEVEPPRENEAPTQKPSTLGNLDPSFTGSNHGRTSGTMTDHEPGLPNNL